jgi:ApbE superfamily uncharacterized protein (UPF0280 family)
MDDYTERGYRRRIKAKDLVSFHVSVKETDLWVSAGRALDLETRDLVLNCRHQIESYIRSHESFLTALTPYPDDAYAPEIVKEMIRAGRQAGVGPMASVAGAIAEYVGRGLGQHSDEVIVENGGDIYLLRNRPATVAVFAGRSPLSEKVGLRIPRRHMPLGVCSSSGTVGHSLSTGRADAVCVLSSSAALADGAATSLGNMIRDRKDLDKLASWAAEIGDLLGGLAILGESLAAWGDVELKAL